MRGELPDVLTAVEDLAARQAAASLHRSGGNARTLVQALLSAKEDSLTDALGRGVKFVGGQKKGRIQLEFYSPDDREALMDALMKMDKPWKKQEKE